MTNPFDYHSTADYKAFLDWYRRTFGLTPHFEPDELLVHVGEVKVRGERSALNPFPPSDLWPNIYYTFTIIRFLRWYLAKPIRLLSVYRGPEYNALVGGAKLSQHKRFNAIDFKVLGWGSPREWAGILKSWRQRGMFKGGIGVYPTFVHVDTRGRNVSW